MNLIRESSLARFPTREAKEQGIEQGIERGLRESTLAGLEERFDVAASRPLAARIAGINDAERLNALLRSSVQVSSLEAFGRLLDQEQD